MQNIFVAFCNFGGKNSRGFVFWLVNKTIYFNTKFASTAVKSQEQLTLIWAAVTKALDGSSD